jgi:glycosyltransferase involved in cell wall biosynthesis
VTGFNGQLDVLVARLLAGRRRVLFAPLVTITETLIDDRQRYGEASLPGRFVRWLDRASFRAADVALVDTKAHQEYVVQRLGVAPERIAVQYLGAPSLFSGPLAPETPRRRPGTRLKVINYSTFLPLHGMRVIAEAARLISPSEGIELELIGSGPEWASCESLVGRLPHVSLIEWVPYADLPERIAAADVALGIFGSTAKARFVIPNKVFQAAELGRAVITADTPAIREVFVSGDSILAIEPEPGALAGALRSLASDSELRRRLGEQGRRAVEQAAGAEVRARRLRELLGDDALLPGAS